jgi:hypothetical protein
MFGDIMRQVLDQQFPVLNWWALVNVMTRAASTITVIAIFIVGTWLHMRGEASVGEIVSFMGFATLLVSRLEGAVAFVSHMMMQAPSLREFFNVLDTTSSVPERPDAVNMPRAEGRVAFEGLGFAYPTSGKILHGVEFSSAPGQTIALVGATGAGKTTAMQLLQRLWDPTEGRITLDGVDLRDITLESLRRNIGVVFQESMLFNRTIRDNLLVGRPDATQDDVERACRMAEAHDFITRQPKGYDTLVGERGRDPLGRAAPAPRHRARPAEGPAGADPGRGDLGAGCRDRGQGAEGAEGADARPHDLHHRPPPVHGARRRRDPGLRAGPHRRAGRLQDPRGPGRPLRRAGAHPADRRGGLTASLRCSTAFRCVCHSCGRNVSNPPHVLESSRW